MADLLDDLGSGASDLWSLLKKDPFAPNDPNAPNQQYGGMNNQQVYNAQRSSVGNVGALLLSAAQRQDPNQRAQTLAQIGTASNIQPQLNAQQEVMMRNQQMQLQQTQIQQQQIQNRSALALRDYLSQPETQNIINSLPKEQQFAIKAAAAAGDVKAVSTVMDSNRLTQATLAKYSAETKASEAATQASQANTAKTNYELGMRKTFMDGGMPGIPGAGAPGTPGTAQVPPGGAAPMTAVPSMAPQGAAQAAPQPGGAAQPASQFGNNPSEVFGYPSPFTSTVRTVQGAVGQPLSQEGMQREQSAAQVDQLNNALIGALRINADGKATTWGMKLTAETLPDPNEWGQAPQRAIAKYQAANTELGYQLQQAQQAYQAAGALGDHAKMQVARSKVIELSSLGSRVNSLVSGLQANTAGNLPPDNPLVVEMRKRKLLQ